jgi:hemin uptake protein HemP
MSANIPPAEQHIARPQPTVRPHGVTPPPGPIHSRELFGSSRQLLIEHSGHVYSLRITQNNKLILTK